MTNALPQDREPGTKASQPAERAGATSGAGGGGRSALHFSKRQIVLAIVIAAASDALCAFVVFAPPAVWAVDGLTAVLLFAVLGLILAAVGLYGLLSYLVTERTNEIGIRMALGAQRSEVMRIMFVDGLRPTLIGLLFGLLLGGLCAQLIRSLLFGVQPLDARIFAAVSLVTLVISMAACLYPAWRAARVDPMTALRSE